MICPGSHKGQSQDHNPAQCYFHCGIILLSILCTSVTSAGHRGSRPSAQHLRHVPMLPSPSEFTQDTGLNRTQFYWLNEIYFFFSKKFPLFLVKIVKLITSLNFSAPKSLWKETTVISLADWFRTHYLVKQASLLPDITPTKASDSPLSQILQFALYLDSSPYYTNKTEPAGGKCWWGRNPLWLQLGEHLPLVVKQMQASSFPAFTQN